MKYNLCGTIVLLCGSLFSCQAQSEESDTTLWYAKPASNWNEAFPLGNGRLAAMSFGGTDSVLFQINEESLWAGSQINPYAENYYPNLKRVQEMVLSGDLREGHDYGYKHLSCEPTSFRSYEPFADLLIEFEDGDDVAEYRRELNLSTGICTESYKVGESKRVLESFISAVDDVLCIRLAASGKGKLNCKIGLSRFKDATVVALPEGRINLDGQIVDVDAPAAYDDNPGGSGPGGKHMRFAGRLLAKYTGGEIAAQNDQLLVNDADEVILIFTAATDYNLALLNFDPSKDPAANADKILEQARQKSWKQIKDAHTEEHGAMFNRVSLDLGTSASDQLPTDKRLEAFKNGAEDNGLLVQMFQFGRYLLMNSSRTPAVLPANLQGKWSEKAWAAWEADYHLNVNLQMNYWPADVANLAETHLPLINWFEEITKLSKPLAKQMYNADGWFSCHASNPFGRVTPSASWSKSQFNNGVLDPLAGAWMVMNLWDHYEYSQDKLFLEERLFPMLQGASGFILDVLVPDADGKLQWVPSTSPENSYIDKTTGELHRICATSTYHLSIMKAVFAATLEAASILEDDDVLVCRRIRQAEALLPAFPVDEDGKLKEWQHQLPEAEPGHRHLSPLLCIHPFALITPKDEALYAAAKKLFDWRKANEQGAGGGWSGAHSAIMHARFGNGAEAYSGVANLFKPLQGTLLNARRVFQIDGNFGATTAIAEMLIQSHLKDEDGLFIITLLPALPAEWQSGSVKGLCARGGFALDFEWKAGHLASAFITSPKGGTCQVRYKNKTTRLSLKPGEKRTIDTL
jgi:alpha-L-fucosidase 2